jgi:signal transduction histidine kinase
VKQSVGIWNRVQAARAWLMVPEPWSPGAPRWLPGGARLFPVVAGRGERLQSAAGPDPRWGQAGELVLALLMALAAAGVEELLRRPMWQIVPVAAGVFTITLLRRRLPVPMLLISAPAAGELTGMCLVLTLVAWSAGRRIEGSGRALAAFIAAFLLNGTATLIASPSGRMPLLTGLLITLIYVVMVGLPGLTSRYLGQRRTLLRALRERNAQLVWEREMVAGQARLLERQRIAQDMHDSLGHQLALISVHTGALEVDPELTDRQREAVGVLRQASVAAMHELREVVGILRDGVEARPGAPVDESGRSARGTAGIGALVESARAAGSTVELRISGEPRPVAAAAGHAAYRIVQESLTNAFKHAPGAPIGVELRYEPDSLVVEIVSGPVGPRAGEGAVSGGQGLTGLRERARLVGGMVHTGPAAHGGFRVAGVLPYGAGDTAPFVAPGEDFPPQSPAAAPGEAVPVMNWDVLQKEPVMSELKRGERGTLGGVGLGCVISLGVLTVVLVAVVGGGFLLFDSLNEGMIDRKKFDSLKVGEPEESVRAALPSGDTFLLDGLDDRKGAPPVPEGAKCVSLIAEETGSSFEAEPVYRFCFKDGKLVEKKSYELLP